MGFWPKDNILSLSHFGLSVFFIPFIKQLPNAVHPWFLSLAILTKYELTVSIYNEENNRIKLIWQPPSSFPFLYNIPLYSSKNVFIKISSKHNLFEEDNNYTSIDYKYVLFYNNQEQIEKSEKKIKINLQDEQILSIIQNSEEGNISLNIADD